MITESKRIDEREQAEDEQCDIERLLKEFEEGCNDLDKGLSLEEKKSAERKKMREFVDKLAKISSHSVLKDLCDEIEKQAKEINKLRDAHKQIANIANHIAQARKIAKETLADE